MEATTAPAKIGSRTVARLVAEFLARRGVRRVYGLCGGHIQPIWDEVARAGIQIVDVRHESAAVYMAQAQADLTVIGRRDRDRRPRTDERHYGHRQR